jgi:hypothetical protein
MLTKDQEKALSLVVEAFGWDKLPLRTIELTLWCLFHYYVRRLK